MLTLLLSIILVLCGLLILVVLAQNSKGGGLTSQFGGSGASNMIGVKKTGDLLERLTWGFIVAIFLLSVVTSTMTGEQGMPSDEFIDRAQEQQAPAAPALDLDNIPQTDESENAGSGLEELESTTDEGDTPNRE